MSADAQVAETPDERVARLNAELRGSSALEIIIVSSSSTFSLLHSQ